MILGDTPFVWWPADGAWPEGELVLTGIEERPEWEPNQPVPVVVRQTPIPAKLAALRGRVFRLTQARPR